MSKETTELSNVKLTEEILKKHKEDEHVQEMLKRFDEMIGCLEQPNLYYREDVEAFVKGKKQSLQPR